MWNEPQFLISILLSGVAYGGITFPKFTFNQTVKLKAGVNKISLLSSAVGLPVSFLPFLMCLYSLNTVDDTDI